MKLTLEQRRKLKNTRLLLLVAVVVSPVYTFFSDGFSSLTPYINSLTIAVLVALSIAFFEFILFTGRLRKIKFYQLFLLRVLLYSLTVVGIITLVMIISRMFRFDLNFSEVLRSEEFQHYLYQEDFLIGSLYTLGLLTILVFTLQMQRKIGPKVLFALVSGRYNRPKKVERIVLFIEIQDVKATIDRIGRIAFFNFLNDIIFDASEIILHRKGDIYEYVENEILVTWDLNKGIDKANCIRTFFEIKEALAANKIYYYERYGTTPELRASLHAGVLIQGVIGEVKSEIKYHGDVMNTAARILGQTTTEHDLLISDYLIDKIDLPAIYQSEVLGEFTLKGKQRSVQLSSLFAAPIYHS